MAEAKRLGIYSLLCLRDILRQPEPPPVQGRTRVYMLNDDRTPMEFVVRVLREVFGMDNKSATRTVVRIHYLGKSSCGDYESEVAEQKVERVSAVAREKGHPLQCIIVTE